MLVNGLATANKEGSTKKNRPVAFPVNADRVAATQQEVTAGNGLGLGNEIGWEANCECLAGADSTIDLTYNGGKGLPSGLGHGKLQ